MEELLIGYDLREMTSRYDWAAERREAYLLKHNLARPLSVDQHVWPSMYEVDNRLSAHLPAWTGLLNLWESLSRLQAVTREGWGDEVRASWMIAISVVVDSVPEHTQHWRQSFTMIEPRQRAADWRFFGYDVADTGFVSALTNCAYSPADVGALRDYWAMHLNSFHLFNLVNYALAFKEVSDKRVPEHAPFAVYGLYLVKEIGM